ncbi:MAG: NADH-quinone oxidoreductase subunit L [Acidobacteria bacterium]|nr:MAG: NADH-quinone oxidoreductase subunit L [Acidobacteriota bacterium]
MNFLEQIWLIPLFPAAGALLNGILGKKLPKRIIDTLACGLVGTAFAFSVGAVLQLLRLPEQQRFFRTDLFTWISQFVVSWGFQLDPLSAVMILVVTGVGFLIHIYSTGYMAHEGGYYRFFAYLNLFMFSMLTLVLANNFVLMFVGWEGVGLCSYLLIGFFFHKKSAADAGKKAFVVNRVGDFGFTLGIFLIFTTFGSLDFSQVFEMTKARAATGAISAGDGVITAICILLFVGAMGKSAQVPLYVWLPDAMEGPTPVSALIHAATMVTAGVYMVARCNALFVLAPKAMMLVAVVGALTAIFAASIGLVQNDIKRVLAYSTVSQLGYMFLGCGVGAFAAGIFHLMTHAFFKALLFLASGSVIHALSGEQDIRKMGGLKDKIRTTWWTMMAGTVAIAGFPPLAGFFSKDEILWQAYSRGHGLLWLIGAVAAGMTSFYMFRMMFLTFHGQSRVAAEVEHHVHESPRSMTVPLMVLAAGSVAAGWVGIPHIIGQYLGNLPNAFERFLDPVLEVSALETGLRPAEWTEGAVMLVSVGIAAVGLLVAWTFYLKNPALPEKLKTHFRALYITLLNKYWVDEIYDTLFVNRTKDLGNLLARFDLSVIDGGVNGSAWLTRLTASISGFFDYWFVDFAVRRSDLIYYMSYPLRRIQTGIIQNYAALTIAGILLIVSYPKILPIIRYLFMK